LPCLDVTETLEIRLDTDDCLVEYKLRKRTCGTDISDQDLLLDRLTGYASKDILSLEPQSFINKLHIGDQARRFLYLKHLLAIQSLLETYMGVRPGDRNSKCIIKSVETGDDGSSLKALIKLSIPTTNIEPCPCHYRENNS
jgi:hypothetical protein